MRALKRGNNSLMNHTEKQSWLSLARRCLVCPHVSPNRHPDECGDYHGDKYVHSKNFPSTEDEEQVSFEQNEKLNEPRLYFLRRKHRVRIPKVGIERHYERRDMIVIFCSSFSFCSSGGGGLRFATNDIDQMVSGVGHRRERKTQFLEITNGSIKRVSQNLPKKRTILGAKRSSSNLCFVVNWSEIFR